MSKSPFISRRFAGYEDDFIDEGESSEFIENPIRSPMVMPKHGNSVMHTPSRLTSMKSPGSSAKRRSLLELKERRNSRLFSAGQEFSRMDLNDTLNFHDNLDILDFDQTILPKVAGSPNSRRYQSSSSYVLEVEELRKKVTGYQLELRLLVEFLQKNGAKELLDKLHSEEFNVSSACNNCEEKDAESLNLKNDLSSCQDKCGTLEQKLRLYQEQLNVSTDQLESLSSIMENSEELMDEVLTLLESGADPKTKSKISQAKAKEMDVRLAVVIMALRQMSSSDKNSSIVRELESKVASLQAELSKPQIKLQGLERVLSETVRDSKILLESYTKLWKLYNAEKDSRAEGEKNNETQLRELNGSMKIMDLENKIPEDESKSDTVAKSKLQNENRLLHQELESVRNSSEAFKELMGVQTRKVEQLNFELSQKVQFLEKELSSKMLEVKELESSLSSQRTSQSIEDKEARIKIRELSDQLNAAVEQQRILSVDKFKLRQQLDSLAREKATVERNYEIAKEKLSTADAPSASTDMSNFWVDQYEGLLLGDSRVINKFLKIFEDILDSQSIAQAKVKVVELSKTSKHAKDPKRIRGVKELHESIFHYYVTATQAIVTDYMSMLKQVDTIEKEKNARVIGLTNELNSLKRQMESNGNGSLEDIHVNDENVGNDSIMQYRIEELNKRWKMERETRKLENESAKKRMKEVEEENFALKEKIKHLMSVGSNDINDAI